jgi:ribosomal protein S6--L-glutamate ligase
LEKFKSFITEQKEEPYKLVMFHNSHEHLRDVGKQDAPDYKLMTKAANTVGVDLFHAEFQGSRIEEKGDKLFLHSFAFDEKTGLSIKPSEDGESDFQKPFEINPENTLIFPRGLGTLGFTSNRRWVDMIKLLENKGFKTVPSIETWDACTSKYYCNELFRLNGLRTPKTIPVTYSDDSKRIMEDLKFPVILKASSGSQTGVGVIIVESLRSLHPTVQMLSLLTKNIDLILQEHIKIEYDVRVIVLRGNVIASMKRGLISGDARSNASLGAEVESIELTELELEDSIKAAKLVNGDLVGVDFLPSKNREKEQPYILEVNSMPGFSGIERATKDKSVTSEILKTYMNRENWR